jgi:hypothetical protein
MYVSSWAIRHIDRQTVGQPYRYGDKQRRIDYDYIVDLFVLLVKVKVNRLGANQQINN